MNRDAVASTHALRAKQTRQPIRPLGQRRVCERLACITHRLVVRRAVRGTIDSVWEQIQHARQRPSSRAMMLRWMSDVPAYSTPPTASRRSRSTPVSLK